MEDLSNHKQFSKGRPEGYTLCGSAADFDNLPPTYREQILFLDKVASQYVYDLSVAAKLVTGGEWQPFAKGNFRTVEEFSAFGNSAADKQSLKKWLYQRGLPFGKWVFVVPGFGDSVLHMTWKMVVKLAGRMFFAHDVLIFDQSLNWCLFYSFKELLSFGKGNVYDPTDDYRIMEEYKALKVRYSHFRFPQ